MPVDRGRPQTAAVEMGYAMTRVVHRTWVPVYAVHGFPSMAYPHRATGMASLAVLSSAIRIHYQFSRAAFYNLNIPRLDGSHEHLLRLVVHISVSLFWTWHLSAAACFE